MNYGVPGVPMMAQMAANSVPIEQPKNLFRYGEQSIWSTQRHGGTAALANGSYRLFTTQQGQVGQGFVSGLTIAETNLKEGGRIPSGVAYDVFGVACQVMFGDSAADTGDITVPCDTDALIGDLLGIQQNGVLSWDFTQTTVDIAPVTLVGAGGGVFGGISTTQTATDRGHLNNGAGSIWLYRRHPVALPGNSTFAILLRYGSRAPAISTNDAFVRVVLMGYYKNLIEIG